MMSLSIGGKKYWDGVKSSFFSKTLSSLLYLSEDVTFEDCFVFLGCERCYIDLLRLAGSWTPALIRNEETSYHRLRADSVRSCFIQLTFKTTFYIIIIKICNTRQFSSTACNCYTC